MRRLLVSLLLLVALPASAYVVNDLGDAPDATPGNNICATAGAVCTLRAAIEEANATAGTQPITFSVAGTISPATPLPAIAGVVNIDGTTAPGYTTAPVVVVDGAFSVAIGFDFAAGSSTSTLVGLQIYGFSDAAVRITSDGVQVRRNHIGPVGGGTPNEDGIELSGNNCTIGGADGDGNVISGNTENGISAAGSGHSIRDNFIGTDAAGTATVPNGNDGVNITGTGVTIGSTVASEWNVIAGNDIDGVGIEAPGSGNTVAGNYIGTDSAGTSGIGNATGVHVTDSDNNVIGTATARNVISGNGEVGLVIDGGTGNVVDGNFIGTDPAGTAALANGLGVRIELANGNTVGTSAAGNLISGNFGNGIEILESDDTIVRNNIVGLDVTGANGLGNGGFGVYVEDSNNVDIGGLAADEGNVLSFNGVDGIGMDTVSNSRIYGNIVGLDAAGTSILGNGFAGITLFSSTSITVGAPGLGMNVISGNSDGGIVIPGGSDHIVQNNRVGTNAAGTAALGNLGTGIELIASDDNIIRSNLISGNDGHGVEMTLGSAGTIVHSNLIGVAVDGTTAIPNGADGVNVCDTATDTVVGSVALGGNTIAFNGANGIGVEPSALLNNTWAANSIHSNVDLGIDIGAIDGVTPNDADDSDTGANNLQNFPVLVSAVTTGTASQVRGTITTTPNTAITVHVYSSPAADPTGFGEGQTYLGTTSFTTDGTGNATFVVTGAATTVGHEVSATATSPDGTSEFSETITVTAAPTVQFSLAAYAAGESDGSVIITVTRTGDLDAISTVNYATSNGTATAADYTSASGTLTFNPGDASETFTVTITSDALDEANETVTLTLSSPTAATLGAPATATLTINDDDPPPSITIGDLSIAEGNSGTANLVFTVSLSAVSGLPVTVDYATANDTATAGIDYTAATGTATIPAGSPSTTISVPIAGDVIFEPNETFFVNLTNPSNATISDNQAIGTITNDDAQPAITISDVTLAEGNAGTTSFIFNVALSGPSSQTITVDYATANNTAVAPGDYTALSTATLTFTPTVTSQNVTVLVNGDALVEPTETFFVNLTNPTNATISDSQGLGTITNDEGVPTITISDVTLAEGNAGTTSFVFAVTLSAPSASTITVDYATANNTAIAPADFTAIPTTTLTFAPTVTSQNVTVLVNGDTVTEATETFFVNLTNATNATIADAQGLGTITSDDAVPAISITDVAQAEGNAGTTSFFFAVSLSNASASTVTVDYATANNTATAPSDFTAIPTTTLTFAPGTTVQNVVVAINGDTVSEPTETFFINLTNPTNAGLAEPQGLGAITNDDGVPTITIGDVTLAEGNAGTTSFMFTVSLSNASASTVTVDYATANNTAVAPSDYTAIPTSTLTFAPGVTSQTITVIVNGDATSEGTETFFVNLSNPTNATIGDAQGVGTITNDDVNVEVIPTLSTWLLMVMGAALALIALRRS